MGVIEVLGEFIRWAGISKYQLAGLLDATSPNTVYRWFQGYICPSPVYWSRLMKLLLLLSKGVPIKRIRRVEWESGRVLWRNGDVTEVHHKYREGPAWSPIPWLVGPGVKGDPFAARATGPGVNEPESV
jgi:hypothetical protein